MPPMPQGAKKPPTKQPAKQEERPVIYDTISAAVCMGDRAITIQKSKDMLLWEDEEQYKARLTAAAGNDIVRRSKASLGFGDDFLLKDMLERKVKCWNNTKNRPFGDTWARALAQDLLNSGPGIQKEKRRWQLNGESIIIGSRGQVISGQHRLIALIYAYQLWLKARGTPEAERTSDQKKWLQSWPTEPTIESVVVTGVDESQHVTRTIDNVKPRSLGDVFYTSDIYSKLSNLDRLECSRMLDKAVKLMWRRTGAKTDTEFLTHGEASDFLERHPRLLRCVKHIFDENKDRQITNLSLSPGICAGLMYLMGCCDSDQETYLTHRTETGLDWSKWDQATEFFAKIGDQKCLETRAVREELAKLEQDKDDTTGRDAAKQTILVRAWLAWCDGGGVMPANVDMTNAYTPKTGGKVLTEMTTIGGIDHGLTKPETVKVQDVEAAKLQEKEARAKELDEKVKRAAEKTGVIVEKPGTVPGTVMFDPRNPAHMNRAPKPAAVVAPTPKPVPVAAPKPAPKPAAVPKPAPLKK